MSFVLTFVLELLCSRGVLCFCSRLACFQGELQCCFCYLFFVAFDVWSASSFSGFLLTAGASESTKKHGIVLYPSYVMIGVFTIMKQLGYSTVKYQKNVLISCHCTGTVQCCTLLTRYNFLIQCKMLQYSTGTWYWCTKLSRS